MEKSIRRKREKHPRLITSNREYRDRLRAVFLFAPMRRDLTNYVYPSECDGAGMPCPVCNPNDDDIPPRLPRGTAERRWRAALKLDAETEASAVRVLRTHYADLRHDNSESARLATGRNPSSVTFPFLTLCISFFATYLRLSWSPPFGRSRQTSSRTTSIFAIVRSSVFVM
jgi:hypothetical protein